MNVARPSDGLLGAAQVHRLLELVSRSDDAAPAQLVKDFMATGSGSLSRSVNTIDLLCDFGVLAATDGRLRCVSEDAHEYSSVIASNVARTIAGRLTDGRNLSSLRLREGEGGLWLDSKMLPGDLNGLPLWMIEFGVASRHETEQRFWRIEAAHAAVFMDGLKATNTKPRRSVTAAKLAEQLEEMAERGRQAELWVLEFEQKRLAGHPLLYQVRRVSEGDVAAGYDLASFSTPSTLQHDLFIEVKSYVGARRFFWSRNEIRTAEEFGEDYCLYIVNFERMLDPGYQPQIIQGPYAALFQTSDSGWDFEPASFEFVHKT